ncbi:lipopolysaccharide biosynthesis protein [Qipengyuania atrilutea]|uniref:Lipopolysaccharide biosynthesis protein n=1 Tax=Qipengyuania atrilutea TaxID=2744473 RepID=A0A850H2E0_9SPHN|nr:lipopolysaccharide biosynthesis protein [Actirhodobacter atriluteus]NVD44747.1 lipopolysaccharide biosynthesis protein [Actirhodobacter atriluteus]
MSGKKGSVVRGVAWVGLGRAAFIAISFVSTIILARLLTPDDFGIVAIASAAAAVVAVVADLPLSQAVIHHDDPQDEHFHTIWTFGLIRGVLMVALIGGSAPFVADFYGDERVTGLLIALAFSSALGSLQNPVIALFERDLVFWQTIVLNLADRLVNFAVSVSIAYIYRSYWAIVLGILAAALVRLILSYVFRAYRPRLSLSKARELMSFSIWLTLGSWVQALNAKADPLVVGYFVRTNQLGIYSMSQRLASMTVGQIQSPIAMVLFPTLARMKHDPVRLQSAYLRVQSVFCTVAFPVGVGIAVLADPIVRLVLGPQWIPTIPIVQVFVLMQAANAVQHVGPISLATGHTRALFWRDLQILTLRAPLLIGGILIGRTSDIGMIQGAVYGLAVSQAIMIVWSIRLIGTLNGIGLRDHFKGAWRPLLACGIMAVSVLAAHAALGPMTPAIEGYATTAALILLGAVTYFLSLFSLWILKGRPAGPEQEALDIVRLGLNRLQRSPS